MNFRSIKLLSFTLFAVLTLIFSAAVSTTAQTEDEVKETLVKALTLVQSGKAVEAIPYLEKLVKIAPDVANLRYTYAMALLTKSKSISDPAQEKKAASDALEQFKEAKRLGFENPDIDTFIKLLGGDPGAVASDKASNLSPVEKLMQQAEMNFAQSKYDEALTYYQKALELDPKNYLAALFSGDVYVKKQDWANAEKSYQRAITIDPNIETAYRFSATPLMRQKKFDQALERYVEAWITEPYNPRSGGGLDQWADATGAKLGHPRIEVPKVDEAGKVTMPESAAPTKEMEALWAPYIAARAEWKKTKFAQAHTAEKTYRHSLKEEADALRAVLRSISEKSPKSAQIESLQKLEKDGFLEAYVLLALPDEGIARDFDAYLKDNRAKLRQYVLTYVIHK